MYKPTTADGFPNRIVQSNPRLHTHRNPTTSTTPLITLTRYLIPLLISATGRILDDVMKPLHALAKQVFVAGLLDRIQASRSCQLVARYDSVLNNSSFSNFFVCMGGRYCIACCSVLLGRLLLRLFAMISYRDNRGSRPLLHPSIDQPLRTFFFPSMSFSLLNITKSLSYFGGGGLLLMWCGVWGRVGSGGVSEYLCVVVSKSIRNSRTCLHDTIGYV